MSPGYAPGPLGRLRYLLGGRLPAHTEWVRHDLTDAGWALRLARRTFVGVLPVVVGSALLPLPGLGLHVMMVVLVLGSWLLTVPALLTPLRDRRLRQHGLPRPGDR